MKDILQGIILSGTEKDYKLWEIHLVTKLNKIALFGMLNMVLGIVFFLIAGYYDFILECALSLVALAMTIVLNKVKNFIWATYCFYIFGFIFLLFISLKMGSGSYVILFYFPVTISLVQLLGRKENLKHLIILSFICLVTIATITIGYKYHFLLVPQSDEIISNLFIFNINLSFITTLFFVLVLVNDYIKQDQIIKNMLKEKEILLSEVFHRVKNNLNVVTSLLNLKKNSSNNAEVKEALEECRSRVFSMALVHQKIYSGDTVGLDFKQYIENLVHDIGNSLGNQDQVQIHLEANEVMLNLNNAIPCGLILNEVITNAYKYARKENDILKIDISLTKENDMVSLIIQDNGPGISRDILESSNTLGFELIASLTDQLNGTSTFENKNGFRYQLTFKQHPF